MKKLNACATGSYSKLQVSLLEGRAITCHACETLLKKFDFKSKDLEDSVQAFIMGANMTKAEPPKEEVDPDPEDATVADACKPKRRKRIGDWGDWGANEEAAVIAYVKTLEPYITLLPCGTYSKRVPYRCTVCKTKKWPSGRVGEASEMKLSVVQHFIGNHVKSSTHYRNLKQSECVSEAPGVSHPCQGMSIQDEFSGGCLYQFQDEFRLWATFTNFADCSKHKYIRDVQDDSWTIHHADCLQDVSENKGKPCQRHICQKCLDLGGRNSIVRNCVRFAIKYWAAKFLCCKMFQGDKMLQELILKIKATKLYGNQKKPLDNIMNAEMPRLQTYVRKSFLCDSHGSSSLNEFLETVVRPCLVVNVSTVPPGLSEISAKFSAMLAAGNLSDELIVDVKMAASSLSGSLNGHPLIQGLVLQTHRLMEKQERGISTMRGRRSAESDVEQSLIYNAGLQLAVAAGNSGLARIFGLSSRSHHISFGNLKAYSLPVPAIAVTDPDRLRENFVLADQRYPRPPMSPKRILDATSFMTEWGTVRTT